MSIPKKRIQVPISSEMEDALDEYCEVSGMGKATVLAGFLSEMVPVIRQLSKGMKLVQSSPSAAVRAMSAIVHDSIDQAEQGLEDLELLKASARKSKGKVKPKSGSVRKRA